MIDPDLVGKELGSVRFPVERSKLYELARALHDGDATWHDPEAAQAAGFERVPLLPTATVLADHWRPDGALAPAIALGADLNRLLHGEAAWEFLRPVAMGEELHATTRVVDITTREGKRGGTMTLATIATDFVAPDGEVAIRRVDTLVETGAAA
ncbi:FAS1-like dehydratase domain-containing protein [Baekduia sp. Peel2402]|uniref:FAS1-like dehydratase domain-containing protein n=1 Tax=Baekduia sp. Peel2402 TaxID=3458296 RepID=UPI00403EC5FF